MTDAMTVTAIEKTYFKGRFRVYLDGEAWLTLERATLSALGIAEGALIDAEELAVRSAPLEAACARERALAMLDRSAKTRHEIERDLQRRQYQPEAVAFAVESMARYAFIDDEGIARRTVEAGVGRLSRRAVDQKLRARGIERDAIGEALDAYSDDDEREAAMREVRKRLLGKTIDPELVRKTVQALARKGFSFDVARDAVRAVTDSGEDDWEN